MHWYKKYKHDMADLIPNFFQNENPFSENQIFKNCHILEVTEVTIK
jgi:hypothetical protein